MKLSIKKTLVSVVCKTPLQPFMHKLYLLALTGMNYGNANTLNHEVTGEKKVIKHIQKKLSGEKELAIFDVGANTGNYTLLVLQVLGESRTKIYAFEPSAPSFGLLVENTRNSRNIKCFNFGLGTRKETMPLYANYEGSGATTLYNAALNNYDHNENITEEITLKTLDEFCTENAIEAIDLLKIDVEGHEFFVLSGAARMLKQHRIKFIQFEFGPFHVHAKTFFKDFWDLLSPGYRIYRIISDGIFEIKAYSENLEIFRTANFLAELKS